MNLVTLLYLEAYHSTGLKTMFIKQFNLILEEK